MVTGCGEQAVFKETPFSVPTDLLPGLECGLKGQVWHHPRKGFERAWDLKGLGSSDGVAPTCLFMSATVISSSTETGDTLLLQSVVQLRRQAPKLASQEDNSSDSWPR